MTCGVLSSYIQVVRREQSSLRVEHRQLRADLGHGHCCSLPERLQHCFAIKYSTSLCSPALAQLTRLLINMQIKLHQLLILSMTKTLRAVISSNSLFLFTSDQKQGSE